MHARRRASRRAVGFALLFTTLAMVPVLAHLAVVKTFPAKGAALATSPDYLQVWFNQEPEVGVSGLSLRGPAGPVSVGAVAAGGEKSLRAAIAAPLAPGAYTAVWKTAGDDGHILRGQFSFRVETARQP